MDAKSLVLGARLSLSEDEFVVLFDGLTIAGRKLESVEFNFEGEAVVGGNISASLWLQGNAASIEYNCQRLIGLLSEALARYGVRIPPGSRLVFMASYNLKPIEVRMEIDLPVPVKLQLLPEFKAAQ